MFGGRVFAPFLGSGARHPVNYGSTAPSRINVLFAKLRQYYTGAAAASQASPVTRDDEENSDLMDWNQLGFSLVPTDYMYVMSCSKEEEFSQGKLLRFGSIELSPSSGILNYGQGLIEGLKAYRTKDKKILLFRPELNALRMQIGAERLCMPSPTTQQFVDAVKQTVLSNKRWVPPPGTGSLYIRPLLMGTGPTLGLAPAPECTFLAYAAPVGNYLKGPYHVLIEENTYRAFAGGTGCVKAITNYSPIYKVARQAKANGFSDVLFLDAATGKYVEEACAANIFIVKGNVISTPPANATILPGITRKSIIEIASYFGYKVEEGPILCEDLLNADEAFCTGTAMVVEPICSVTYKGQRIEYNTGGQTVSQRLGETLTGIQTRSIEDTMGWTVEID